MSAKAILLAAGQGTRLRPLTDDRPKCLVEWRGRSLLERALEALGEAGIGDVTVVGGYCAHALVRPDLRLVLNPRYESTNMVHSLFCAEDQMAGDDLLVAYSDIVFHPRILRPLLDCPAPIAVAVDLDWRSLWEIRMADPLADAETLKVDGQGDIVEIGGKPTSYDQIQGQYVGLIKVSRDMLEPLRRFYRGLDRLATYGGRAFERMFMTDFLQVVIDRLTPVRAVFVRGGWIEIDSVEDLAAYRAHEREILARLE